MSEIKYKKIPAPAGHLKQLIPLKVGSNGRELSEQCSIFVWGVSEHCQLIPRIDGIDWNFLFGNVCVQVARVRIHPLPLTFGGHLGE